ncbi:unnamed protein product, partial [Closterium sp. Naga37s-1]
VRGSDADSLAHTREAQRDIWTNQMPPRGCQDRRLLVAPWPDASRFSLARQLHGMAALLALAMLHNRTLVPLPGTFQPANNQVCREFQPMGGMGSDGSVGDWGCFFFPIASPHCSADISAAMAASRMPPCQSDTSQFEQLATSADRVVCLDVSDVDQSSSAALSSVEARVTKIWGRPHVEQQAQREYLGEVPPTDDFRQQGTAGGHRCNVHGWRAWGALPICACLVRILPSPSPRPLPQLHCWRAQAVRFMLRWPSAHLCHVINQQRHTAYGMHVANHIASLPAIYASILQSVAATSAGPAAAQNIPLSAEASDLAMLDLIPGSNPDSQPRASSMGVGLEARVWGARGFDRCSERCGGVGMGEYGRVGGEPLFVVRPMVGVVMGGSGGTGVGGGGRGEEGRGGRGVLTSSGMGVGVHVMAASVLRLSDVDVRHMWVSWHAQLACAGEAHVGQLACAGEAHVSQLACAGEAHVGQLACAGEAHVGQLACAGEAHVGQLACAGEAHVGQLACAGEAHVGQLACAGEAHVGQLACAGEAHVGQLACAGEAHVGQLACAGEAHVGQLACAGEAHVGQLACAGEAHVGQLACAGEAHVGQLACAGEAHVGQLACAGEAHVGQLACAGEAHVGQLACAGEAHVGQLHAQVRHMWVSWHAQVRHMWVSWHAQVRHMWVSWHAQVRHMWVSWHAQLPPPNTMHLPDWTLYMPSPSPPPTLPSSPSTPHRLLQQQAPPAPAAGTAALSPSPASESAAAAIGPAAPAAGAGSTVGDGESGGSEGAGGGSMDGAVEAGGDGSGDGERMARLVVAAQCDAFVGMHGDEWAELLDEMRCTGGRRQSRFVFINVP